jgi:hypothetical protein
VSKRFASGFRRLRTRACVSRELDTKQSPGERVLLPASTQISLEMDMNGALMKASSRFAMAAALGLALGAGSARAADLGGNCCADLEERIAELEATTARKGNRKMSLTITGQVHRMVLWWDDGKSSDTYYGLDNTNSSTRFSLLGEAKVTSNVKMGFEIMLEIEAGGTSSKVSQWDEDGKLGTQINGTLAGSFNASNVDAYFGDARRAAWWVEEVRLGRLTVGRYESAGVVNTIDLGGISAGASSSVILVNGSFNIRGPNGEYYGTTWATLGDPAASQGRTELIRYDSPTIMGFVASASIAEAGDYWGAMLRYAGEFSGVRVAAGIGYESVTDRQTQAAGTGGPFDLTLPKPEVNAWGASLAALHVPTGLFAQGHYMAADFSCNTADSNATALGGVSQYWGQTTDCRKDADQWLVQAGITKNWTGLGNTAIFGEYSISNGWGAGSTALGRNIAAPFGGGLATAVNGVTDTQLTVWGVGITQNIDAAATELYLDARHFSADITCTGAGGPGVCTGAAGAAPTKLSTEDGIFVIGGARLKF